VAITSQDGHPLFCCSIASTKHIKKNIFTDEIKCSITLAEIEFYIEILLPAYRFTLLHQRNSANIAEVVPTLQMLIKKYEQFAVDNILRVTINGINCYSKNTEISEFRNLVSINSGCTLLFLIFLFL
jgi:hypothetical protein